MQQNIKILWILLLCLVSCGELQVDNTKAYPLVQVSLSHSPAFEDIREFVPYRDLIYAAAGSGGILTYRIVGDTMSPVAELSLTNLVADNLEQIYIRTVEVVPSMDKTNLIFAYDTLSGGGIAAAEITENYTKPIGSLQVKPNLRLKKTVSSVTPEGKFLILAADASLGVLSFELSFLSNNNFDQGNIASLVDMVAQLDIQAPLQGFATLGSPDATTPIDPREISDINQLLQLAQRNPQAFQSVLSNLPFLNQDQVQQLSQLDPSTISNLLNSAQNILGQGQLTDILQNSNAVSLLNSPLLNGFLSSLGNKQSSSTNTNEQLDPQLSNTNQSQIPRSRDVANEVFLTDTLFEESFLSNLNSAEQAGYTNVNRFFSRSPVENARQEIDSTIQALGRRYFADENEALKNALYNFSPEQMYSLFSAVFQQANSAMTLLPLLENAGLNIQELYQFYKDQDYQSLIESLDASLIAELLRTLPRYQVSTILNINNTNFSLPSIKTMNADDGVLIVAAGMDGFYILDRTTGAIIDSKKKPFSDVSTVISHRIYNKDYYIVADKLDGLVMYEQLSRYKIGEQVARLTLVGEAFDVQGFEDILWVADGSDGVLAVRVNRDRTFTIEAENYRKKGYAYYIGAVRRREALASYGSGGLSRLRITNVEAEGAQNTALLGVNDAAEEQKNKSDFLDRMLEWSQSSRVAQWLSQFFSIN